MQHRDLGTSFLGSLRLKCFEPEIEKISEANCYRVKKTKLKASDTNPRHQWRKISQLWGSNQKLQQVSVSSWRLKDYFALAFLTAKGLWTFCRNTALTAQGFDSYAMLVSSAQSEGAAHGCHRSHIGVSVSLCMSLALGLVSYLITTHLCNC